MILCDSRKNCNLPIMLKGHCLAVLFSSTMSFFKSSISSISEFFEVGNESCWNIKLSSEMDHLLWYQIFIILTVDEISKTKNTRQTFEAITHQWMLIQNSQNFHGHWTLYSKSCQILMLMWNIVIIRIWDLQQIWK